MPKSGHTPPHIADLVRRRDQRPTVPLQAPDCLAWGIPVRGVWVPFFLAANAAGHTDIPVKTLGAPLRQRHKKDGTPVYRVNGELATQIRIVRENLMAGLSYYAGR